MNIHHTRLKKTIEIIEQKKQINENDIDAIITKTRQLIEAYRKQEKYTLLNLYCNWFLHTKLENSMKIYRMLESINNKILSNDMKLNPQKHTAELNAKISNCLEVNKLKEEFIDFYKCYGISTYIFDNDNLWKVILSSLIYNLIDKPIKFPEKILAQSNSNLNNKDRKIQKICCAMKKKALSFHWYIHSYDNPSKIIKKLPLFVTYLTIKEKNNIVNLEIGLTYNPEGINKYPVVFKMQMLHIPKVIEII